MSEPKLILALEEEWDKAAADTTTPWLPSWPPVPNVEASESRGVVDSMRVAGPGDGVDATLTERGVPDVEAHKREAKKRKEQPLYSGCFAYFPDALIAVAEVSFLGNQWHNPGQPLHWDRSKSMDQHDALLRHLTGAGTIDSDGIRHSAKVAWRALAALQLEIEASR